MKSRKILATIFSILIVCIVLGYSYFALGDYIRGPQIELSSPENGFSTTTQKINIIGKTIHTNVLFINDASTTLDLKGNFSESLLLSPGYNIIKVKAEDRYHRFAEKDLEIVLMPQSGPDQELWSASSTPKEVNTATSSTAINNATSTTETPTQL